MIKRVTSATYTVVKCVMLTLGALVLPGTGIGAEWRSYEVYEPTIERSFVVDGYQVHQAYHHCPTIAWYKGYWIAMWGSVKPPVEHHPGQRAFFSTSEDGRQWTPMEMLFSNSAHCANAVDYPAGKGHQWQPNLIVVDDELWAFWNQGGSRHDFALPGGGFAPDLRGLYFSRLKGWNSMWENRLLLWNGANLPTVDGRPFSIAATQNPIRLSSGRVLVPVSLFDTSSRKAADAPPSAEGWWAKEKINTVIYSDDLGKTWNLSPGTQKPGSSHIQWEPTVWEAPGGVIHMVSRNNTNIGAGHGNITSAQFLLSSISRDGGATWTPQEYLPIETVCSRMHVFPADGRGSCFPVSAEDVSNPDRRFVMCHNDIPGGRVTDWHNARSNLSLFFTRGGGFDFVAGNNISGNDYGACYPQMALSPQGVLGIVYSRQGWRGIRFTRVSPLPEPEKYYLFPRCAAVPFPEKPNFDAATGMWYFNKGQRLDTLAKIAPIRDGFTFAAWFRADAGNAVFDCRHPGKQAGFCVTVGGGPDGGKLPPDTCFPSVSLMTKPHVITTALPFPRRMRWGYLGLTVDNPNRTVSFFVDGREETVPYEESASELDGDFATIMCKHIPQSRLEKMMGVLRFLAVYPAGEFGTAGHRWLHDRFASELDRPALGDGREPTVKPILWLDGKDAVSRKQVTSPVPSGIGRVEAVVESGQRLVRFHAEASTGVDVDHNERVNGDTVELRFRFRIDEPGVITLCTIGDANFPARVVWEDGRALLRYGPQDRSLGPVVPGTWYDLHLTSAGKTTSACLGTDGNPLSVDNDPSATWVYLGEGYPSRKVEQDCVFSVDLASVQTRVSPPAE